MKFDDDRIEVEIDKKWLKRFRFSPEAKELRKENATLKIRVIKREYRYTDNKNKEHCENLIYFINLSSESFSTDEIMEIYSRRWDIEVSYKTMKTIQEVERHISSDGDVARNDIYAKVLFHNIVGVIRKEMNQELENRHTPDTEGYVKNITQLQAIIHDTNFLYCFMFGLKERIKEKIDNITNHLNKIRVPVRPNRHFQRWGRIMKSPPSYHFRLDGRNNSKYRRHQSVLMIVAP